MSSSNVKTINFKKFRSKRKFTDSSSSNETDLSTSAVDRNQTYFSQHVQHHSTPKPPTKVEAGNLPASDSSQSTDDQATETDSKDNLRALEPGKQEQKPAQHQSNGSDEAENSTASHEVLEEGSQNNPTPLDQLPAQHVNIQQNRRRNVSPGEEEQNQVVEEESQNNPPPLDPLPAQQVNIQQNRRRNVSPGDEKQNQLIPTKPRVVKIKKKTTKRLRGLEEIRQLQATVDLLIPRLPFQRVVREIFQQHKANCRLQGNAIASLHESAEMMLIELFEDAVGLATHRARKTVSQKDFNMSEKMNAKYLKCLQK